LIRRFNITHLLENGKRIVPLDLIIDYRFIKLDEIIKVSIWCTTNNKGYKCLGVQTLFRPTDNKIPLSYTLDFNTDILALRDREATGLFIHIDNAEFIELKRLSMVYNVASRITGRSTDIEQWIDPDDKRLFVFPFVPSTSIDVDKYYVTPFIATAYGHTVEVFTVTPFGISITESVYVTPFIPSSLIASTITPFIASIYMKNVITPFVPSTINGLSVTPFMPSTLVAHRVTPFIPNTHIGSTVTPFIPSKYASYGVTPFICSVHTGSVTPFVPSLNYDLVVTPFNMSTIEGNNITPFIPSMLSGDVITPFIASTFITDVITPFGISTYVELSVTPFEISIRNHSLSISSSKINMGTIEDVSKDYIDGEVVPLIAYPNDNSLFDYWTVDGEVVSNNVEYDFTMPDHDVVIVAYFKSKEDNLFFLGDLITPPVVVTDNLFYLSDVYVAPAPTITHNQTNNTIEMT